MKLIEIVNKRDIDLTNKIETLLMNAKIHTEPGDDDNEIIFDFETGPLLTGLIKIKNGKLFVHVQGNSNDIDVGEMDPKTLVKDLKSMNTKKWFKEWDPEMDD